MMGVFASGVCAPGRAVVARVRRRWRAHAPRLWWGDAIDGRFLVAAAVARLRGVRVLDVGCNAGVLLAEVPHANRRIGIDLSPDALSIARGLNPTATLAVADMLALPLRSASVDVVLFCGMLEVPAPERKADALAEVARVLRPGGRLYLTTLNRRYPRYRGHERVVTYGELRVLLAADFDADIGGFNPFPPFPRFLPNRVLARIPGIWPLLVALMRRGVARDGSCSFLVEATRR
jgi:SAM-dependent methyltransferase